MAPAPVAREAEPVWLTLLSGSIAATTATFAKQPIARVKFLRQVSESATTVDQTRLLNIYSNLIKDEGFFRALYRGSTSACLRNIPHSIIVYTLFPIYTRTLNCMLTTESNAKVMRKLNNSFAGALASLNAHIITHPLDTVRVRIAVQYQHIEYPSIMQTAKTIRAQEGINGFYRGLHTTIFGAIFRAGIGFGIYEGLKTEEMKQWNSTAFPLISRLSIGFVGGVASTFISYPIDTVRRRQMVFGKHRDVHSARTTSTIGGKIQDHVGSVDAFRWILRTEGIRGLYKGIVLALIKSPLAASISLTTNDVVKGYLGWKS